MEAGSMDVDMVEGGSAGNGGAMNTGGGSSAAQSGPANNGAPGDVETQAAATSTSQATAGSSTQQASAGSSTQSGSAGKSIWSMRNPFAEPWYKPAPVPQAGIAGSIPVEELLKAAKGRNVKPDGGPFIIRSGQAPVPSKTSGLGRKREIDDDGGAQEGQTEGEAQARITKEANPSRLRKAMQRLVKEGFQGFFRKVEIDDTPDPAPPRKRQRIEEEEGVDPKPSGSNVEGQDIDSNEAGPVPLPKDTVPPPPARTDKGKGKSTATSTGQPSSSKGNAKGKGKAKAQESAAETEGEEEWDGGFKLPRLPEDIFAYEAGPSQPSGRKRRKAYLRRSPSGTPGSTVIQEPQTEGASDMFGALHDFLSFRMKGVDNLVGRRIKDIQANAAAANEAFQEKVNSRIEEIEIMAGGSGAGKRRKRRGQPADILASHPFRVQFNERIRHFVDDHLLKVSARVATLSAASTSNMVKSKLGRALVQFRPLTEQEWQAYEDNTSSAIKVDANNFRLDFSRSRREEFNREALHVAAEAFIASASSGYLWGDTTSSAIPSELLEYEVVAYAIDNHAEYLWSVYNEATRTDSAAREKARLARSSRTSRKASLHANRLDTALADPEYRRFAPLIKRIGVQGMSDDETDDEEPDTFVRVGLPWRAERLTKLLWALDERHEEHLRSSVGKSNRRRGPLPRTRRPPRKSDLKATPPRKLPKNLYNSDWLQQLKPHQRKAVAPEDATYNFQTGKVIKKKSAPT